MRSQRTHPFRPPNRSHLARTAIGTSIALGVVTALTFSTQATYAIGTAVGLGTADSYSVLAGQSVTNTGESVLNRDLGVSPGSAITGFPPGIVLGTVHTTDEHALQAQADLTTAYNNAAGQASDAPIAGDLGGRTLSPGVYTASSSIGLTGTVTLDGENNPDAVFIFQIGSALTTAPNSTVALINGAQSCNVFWQIGSSATLDTSTTFVGTVMALTSITANNGTTVDGRALARNGSVSLDTVVFTGGSCAVTQPPDTTPPVTPPPDSTPPVTSTPPATTPATTPPSSAPPVSASPTAGSSSTASPTRTSSGSPTQRISPVKRPGLPRTGDSSTT